MRRQRRFRKEDISDPSNFVHVQHVGFGQKKPLFTQQRSLDLDQENYPNQEGQENSGVGGNEHEELVERRIKGPRSSLIPRHHRSTTTCIFPEHQQRLESKISVGTKRENESPGGGATLKPTFGSLLNLSFLPLGLGKSSSKSNISKTKRASLLNLTASHLFSSAKPSVEGNTDSIHMTSYTRRRSFSSSVDENEESNTTGNNGEAVAGSSQDATAVKLSAPSRIPLSKLGRSHSTMSEFNKRPKLRLKILPPPPPPPSTLKPKVEVLVESQDLPSPPPTPLPSPPPSPNQSSPETPQDGAPTEDMVVKRIPRSPPRPRIIAMPSSVSMTSLGPVSPQFYTPAGGSSPAHDSLSESPMFPLISPTIPPMSTPFFPTSQNRCDTPSTWPLQPMWPTSIASHQTHPTIPEIPSPSKEEMDAIESEYEPVASIVDSFISNAPESNSEMTNAESDVSSENMDVPGNDLTEKSIQEVCTLLQKTLPFNEWPFVSQALFQSIQPHTTAPEEEDESKEMEEGMTSKAKETYDCIIAKTMEFWGEMFGGKATAEELLKVLEKCDEKCAESLRATLLQTDKTDMES